MTRQSISVVVLFAAALMLAAAPAQAGPIFLAGKLVDGKFVPPEGGPQLSYTVRYSTITASVTGKLARIKIQETIAGPDDAVPTVCVIPLPKGTGPQGTLVAAGIPNADHAVLPSAKYLPADKAQELYESIAQALGSVKILSLSDRPALLVPHFKLNNKIEIVVQFQQRIQERDGVRSFECPMPATDWTAGPVARLSLAATVKSAEPLRAMFSPTHTATVEREGLHQAVVRVKADDHQGSDDFRLCWVADEDDLGLRVVAFRSEIEDEDGYFMLLGNPTGSDDERVIDKDMIFVLDTSGSMRGEKIEQARAAIEYCLGQLEAGDRFNIITFGTEVQSFRDDPVAASEETVAAARDFIEDVVAQGRTNIGGALAKAMAGKPEAGRPRITIFLTDGTPTAGELVPDKIVESVQAVQPCPTRIFVMGVGHDVNAHLLDKLAEATDGSSQYVEPDEEIDVKVAALYDRLSHPVLTNVQVAFGELRPHSVYPEKLPALFKGSEVMVFGRYRGGGEHTFTVSGMLAGEPTRYACTARLPEKPSPLANEFIAPLWAARKIGYLLQEIRLHGENEELIAEVVRLSKKFGVVTEYTEFIASAGGAVSSEVALNEARRRMGMANAVKAGQWAFNQARNDKQMQQRMVATQGANYYLDRQGRAVANTNLRQMGRQVFYLNDGQWVDAEEQGERKTRVVKLFSKEYNDLVRSNVNFARAQKLGWAVSVNLGDERIVVERDGVQRDENLRQQAPPQAELQQQNFIQNQRGFNQIPAQQLQQIRQMPQNQLPNLQLNEQLDQRLRLNRQQFEQIRRNDVNRAQRRIQQIDQTPNARQNEQPND